MLKFCKLNSGISLYKLKYNIQSFWFIGGSNPENNCHFVIERPESVSLVKPPTTIIIEMITNIEINQMDNWVLIFWFLNVSIWSLIFQTKYLHGLVDHKQTRLFLLRRWLRVCIQVLKALAMVRAKLFNSKYLTEEGWTVLWKVGMRRRPMSKTLLRDWKRSSSGNSH